MNQEKIMSEAEDQWLDDLNDAHWQEEWEEIKAKELEDAN